MADFSGIQKSEQFKLHNFRGTAMSKARMAGISYDDDAVAFGCHPECHNTNEQLRRAARKDKAVAVFVRKLASHRDTDRIVLMAKAVIRSQGGLHNFAAEWKKQHQGAMTESPEIAYRYLAETLRLLELADRLERS